MNIILSKKFLKNFRKRVLPKPKLLHKYDVRAKLFREDPTNKVLNDHPLKGVKKNYRSFWVAGDVRVIYEVIDKKTVKFIDIGSHNQVYT